MVAASTLLDTNGDVYDPEIFVQYTMRIIEHMGGAGVRRRARRRAKSTTQWSSCHHFEMYEDVPDVLRALHASGLKIGLISNTQRSSDSVSEPLRTRRYLFGRRLVLRSRLHEAAPQHLRGCASAGRRHAAGGGHGRRQRAGRYRRRSRHGHARRARVALRAHRPPRRVSRDVPRIQSLRELPDLL